MRGQTHCINRLRLAAAQYTQPWSHQEREEMVRACLTDEENARLLCLPLMDVPYNDELWVRNVQTSVNGLVTAHYSSPHRPANIALIGHKKIKRVLFKSVSAVA